MQAEQAGGGQGELTGLHRNLGIGGQTREWLAAGKSQKEILADYPELEPGDFQLVFEYAARGAASEVVA
jgi:hypothetical protein